MVAFDRLAAALADRYAIERELGEGGMATVYLAEDLKHHRQVAVKVLRPELAAILGAERFLREIEVAAHLNHPHILPLFDSGEADGLLFYVMPFLEGESLRTRLARARQLGVEETVEITKAVAAALDHAHRQGVVHRDIKPENVLLQDGQAVVADFGIALAVRQAGGTRLTETGMSLGTPHYMSPEQAMGDQAVDGRSDIYSLGAMAYEMLVGEPPHVGNSVQAIMGKILTETPPPVTRVRELVPPNVDAAVHRALAKSPADRFATAQQFGEALTDPAFSLPTPPSAIAGASPAGGLWNRLSITLASLLGVTFVVLVAAVGWFRPGAESPRPVARYQIALPEEGQVLGRIAVSPDGSVLAYVGAGEVGTQLWIKHRSDVRPTPIPGTDDAVAPFFSPDGEWVGFIGGYAPAGANLYGDYGAVKKVSVRGGVITTLADGARVRRAYGAAWLDGGRIVFVARARDLAVLPDTGGQPERLVGPGDIEGFAATAHVTAIPAGRGLLVTTCTAGCSESAATAVWTVDLETGATRVLIDGGFGAWYSHPGHVLYGDQRGNVFSVPFDLETLELTGSPVRVLEGVAGRNPVIALSEGGDLFYLEGSGGDETTSQLVWVTRGGPVEQIDPGWTARFHYPALSPDGMHLAVGAGASPMEYDLWIKPLDGGGASRLTFAAERDYRPAWTPDGSSVAFVSGRRGGHHELYVKRADGTGEASLLLELPDEVDEVEWHPSGEWFVYRSDTLATKRDIFAVRLGPDSVTVAVATVPGVDEYSPTFSPDGRWLAFVSEESGNPEVYVRPFPDVESGRWQISHGGGTEPVWAHSGREVFHRSGGNLVSTSVRTTPTFIPGRTQVLFSLAGYYRAGGLHPQYDVSQDDQRFLMIRAGSVVRADLILVENFAAELARRE